MRRIPPAPIPKEPTKDASGAYVKESPDKPSGPPVTPDPPTDVDLDELQDKVRLILYREIRNLTTASAAGLLSREESQSLVNYAKLVSELKKAEDTVLKGLTDEDLGSPSRGD